MNEPRQINFNDLRSGDEIQARNADGSVHVTRAGVVDYVTSALAMSEDGRLIAARDDDITLLHRPAPEIPVGATGTATVGTTTGVRVMRLSEKHAAGWVSATPVAVNNVTSYLHDAVTDFVPDVLWTVDLGEELISHVRDMRIFDYRRPVSVAIAGIRSFRPGGDA